MSIYLDEKNPGKHKPFDDASQDIVEYVRYLEVIAGKSANTAFSYYCDLRGFSRFMKRRRGLVPADAEITVELLHGHTAGWDEAAASFDGDTCVKLGIGDCIRIYRSSRMTRLIKINNISFLEVLRNKMNDQ